MKTMMKFFLQLMQMASPPWRSPRCSTVFSFRIMRTNQDNKVETIFILHNFSTQIISPLGILFSGGSLIILGLNPDLQSFMWRFCPLLNEFSCVLINSYHVTTPAETSLHQAEKSATMFSQFWKSVPQFFIDNFKVSLNDCFCSQQACFPESKDPWNIFLGSQFVCHVNINAVKARSRLVQAWQLLRAGNSTVGSGGQQKWLNNYL